jgi:uncharacterized membrane protein
MLVPLLAVVAAAGLDVFKIISTLIFKLVPKPSEERLTLLSVQNTNPSIEPKPSILRSLDFHSKIIDRVKCMSDGVFSIVLTVLVLDIRAPLLKEGESKTDITLWHKLVEMWPAFLSLALSFSLVGNFWKTHSLIMRGIEISERLFLYLNNLFLVLVSLVPISAQILSDFPNEPISAIIFNLLHLILGIVLFILFVEVNYKNRLKGEKHRMSNIGSITAMLRILLGPVVYSIGIGIAFVNVYASVGIAFIIPLMDFLSALGLDIFAKAIKFLAICLHLKKSRPTV